MDTGNTAELRTLDAGAVTLYSFTIQGHREERFAVEGTLALEFSSFGAPENCPCTMGEATVLYFTSSSMFSDVYIGEDATIILTKFTQLDDENFQLAGEFSGVLFYAEDAMEEPDPERTLEVSGHFEATASKSEIDF